VAVYTEVSDDELTEFLAGYDIGELRSAKGIAEGVENSNYLLHTTSGSFFLTLYEKRVREDELPFFLRLIEFLAHQGIDCPQPVRDREGRALRRLAGRPAAIVTFLEGLSIRRPTPKHCGRLGEALAKLHAAGARFELQRKNTLSVEAWRPLLQAAGTRADQVAPGIHGRAQAALADVERNWPKALPSGIIHADLFTDNVFFIGDRLSGLIDFYFACTDAFAYDLAICLNAWCFEADGSFNLTKGQALIGAYEQVRRLSGEEVAALPLLCQGAALRFMLTRLVDWLDVPPGALVKPKDPLEYDRKLGFHRRVTDAAEYGLVRHGQG
jgi:homoserine kinase type II